MRLDWDGLPVIQHTDATIYSLGPAPRRFLLLQGPCGRFYSALAAELKARRCDVLRIVLSGGDWVDSLGQERVHYRKSFSEWPVWLRGLVSDRGITDAVIYGDCRPYHRTAIKLFREFGIRVHALEEGYIRPNWITYERDGVNGHSPLINLAFEEIDAEAVKAAPLAPQKTLLHGFLGYVMAGIAYYAFQFFLTFFYARYRSHRDYAIVTEATFWLMRFFTWPWRLWRAEGDRKFLEKRGTPVHLALLQLDGDSQIQSHSAFDSIIEFIELCIRDYARSGSHDQALVFKNHPLDNGMLNLRRVITEVAVRHGVKDRVFFIDAGKLAPLLENACSVISVNSTACHQSLKRGIPTAVLGQAIYRHPEITPHMKLADFFRLRPAMQRRNYELFYQFLCLTCQVNGGFYTRDGVMAAAGPLVERMLSDRDPYEVFRRKSKATGEHAYARRA